MFSRVSDEETTVTTPSFTEDDEPDKPTVEVCEPPDETFEPTEHRHFGVIRYTVHTRFRKLMLIGLVNIIIVVALFLFIYFAALAQKNPTVTTVHIETSTKALTVTVTTHDPKATTVSVKTPSAFSPKTTTSVYTEPTCITGFLLADNKCLKIIGFRATHDYSASACAEYGGTLFTAKTKEDNIALNTFLKNRHTDNVWMGLYCFVSNSTQCLWDSGSDTTELYSSFDTGFPDVTIGRCVYFKTSSNPEGLWESADCDLLTYLMCEIPTTSHDTCENNFNNHCYFPQWGGGLTLSEAMEVCSEMCATVASVHSDAENRFLVSILTGQAINYFILLGGMVTRSGYIYWLDGSPMDYNNIQFDRGGNCLLMNIGGGGFYKTDCTTFAWYICKRPTGTVCPGSSDPPLITAAPYTNATQTCNTDIMMAPGAFSSPNYPNNYPANSNCSYTLATIGGNRINLTFTDFETEKCCGKVYVFDGDSSLSPLIDRFSGGQRPDWILPTGPFMFVQFLITANQNDGYKGFNAIFSSIFQTSPSNQNIRV